MWYILTKKTLKSFVDHCERSLPSLHRYWNLKIITETLPVMTTHWEHSIKEKNIMIWWLLMWKLALGRVLTKNKIDDHNTDLLTDVPLLNKNYILVRCDDGNTDLLMFIDFVTNIGWSKKDDALNHFWWLVLLYLDLHHLFGPLLLML